MDFRRLCFFAAALAASTPGLRLLGQVPVAPTAAGQHTDVIVTLGHYDGIYFVRAPDPPPPINVLPGSNLRFVTGYDKPDATSIDWYRDNVKLATTSSALEIADVTVADSGIFTAVIQRPSGPLPTIPATVRVGVPVRQSLLNVSSRTFLSPANPILIVGFIVAAGPEPLRELKTVLVRAVGPTLGDFKVPQPLADPQVRLFRADGTPVVTPATVRGTPSLAWVATQVGAFPLRENSADVALLFTLPSGDYTAHVSSISGGSGDVLAEVYDVPDSALGPKF